MRSRRLVAAAALAAVLAPAGIGGAFAAGSSSSATPVSVSISQAAMAHPVSRGFLGLAFEYKTVQSFIGHDPKVPNPVLVELVHNLTPDQRPVIRIGGESTDRIWLPVRHMSRPLGVTETLTPQLLQSIRTLADALGGRLILGLNLEANRTRIAGAEARAVSGEIPKAAIQAVEIGNEPELYAVVPWYEVDHGVIVPWYLKRHGTPVLARKAGYDVAAYTGEFSRFRKVVGELPVAAFSTGNFHWLSALPSFLSAEPSLSMVTFHRYGLNGCVTDPHSQSYPTVPNLLATGASRGILKGISTYVALAHQHRISFRIDEMNSVTCGGRRGVSDTFASALWALDALFAMAADGVDGVNIHTFPNSTNAIFDFQQSGNRWQGTVHPEYYGLLMFAQAAPAGSTILRIHASTQPDVREWATLAPDHRIRLVLINDSLSSSHTVRVTGPVGGTATLERLQSRSAYSTGPVTLGGRSFAPGTKNGRVPVPSTTSLRNHGGAYELSLPAASAALITFR